MMTLRVLIILLLIVSTVEAKSLYVNNSGSPACSDSTTYADNSASSPWCTIGRAAWGNASKASANSGEAAAAGDTVLVTAGTYTETGTLTSCGSEGRFTPILDPVNSGSSGNPITFRGSGTVNLKATSGRVGPIIGALNKTYIIWDNFIVDDQYLTTCSDTGPVVFWGSDNCQLLNSTVIGSGDIAREDNYCGVRMESAQYLTIQNTKIYNFGPNEGHNSAGIMTYYSGGLLVQNSEIYDCGSCIFLKANTTPTYPTGDGHQTWHTITKNYIHDCKVGGVIMHRTHQSSELQKVTQNIFKSIPGDEGGVYIFIFGDAESDPNNVKIVNNTFVDVLYPVGASDMLTVPTGNTFWNNITYNASSSGSVLRIGWGETNYDVLNKTRLDFEHNNYYNAAYFATGEGVAAVSLATFKANYSQDSASPESVTSDPSFVNYAGGNFKLQAGSPALTLGRTITAIHGTSGETIPAGAYITGNETIGIETSGGSSTRKLNNVTGVRVTLH